VSLVSFVALGAAVAAVGWFVVWMWTTGSVRLAATLASIHRCGRVHPDWTHERWVELVEKPCRTRWYERHGIEP
jgi:hypothetical protein